MRASIFAARISDKAIIAATANRNGLHSDREIRKANRIILCGYLRQLECQNSRVDHIHEIPKIFGAVGSDGKGVEADEIVVDWEEVAVEVESLAAEGFIADCAHIGHKLAVPRVEYHRDHRYVCDERAQAVAHNDSGRRWADWPCTHVYAEITADQRRIGANDEKDVLCVCSNAAIVLRER